MKKLKIIFFGSPSYSVPLLDRMINLGHDVQLVVSQGTNKTRRGKRVITAIHKYCLDNNIDCITPSTFDSETFEIIKSSHADLGMVYAYGKLIPEDIINLFKHGIINLHCSLLPSYRGAAPIQHALINDEKFTGFTFFKIDEKLDEGQILLKEKYEIKEIDNCSSIQDNLTSLATAKLSDAITKIINNDYLDSNENIRTSYARKVLKEDSFFSWNDNVRMIFNKIRAYHLWPIASTELFNEKIKVIDAEYLSESHDLPFGRIKEFSKKNLSVTANGGYLSIKKLQLEGMKPISNVDLFNGHSKFRDRLLLDLSDN